jgi:hypothetical protein
MKIKSNAPTVTSKFPIEVPTHEYYSNYSVYKVWFGKYFLIWKGKSLLQSVQSAAILIERGVRLSTLSTDHYLYNVVKYIIRARVTRGYVEIKDIADFDDTDWLKFLRVEQELLTAHKNDTLCLNNNFIAYVPEWMGAEVKKDFDIWMKERFSKPKNIKKKKGVRA